MKIVRDCVALVGMAVMAWGIWGWSRDASLVFIGICIIAGATSSAIEARGKQ